MPLTAFIPNDRAFQVLAADLTGRWYGKETRSSRRSRTPSASTPSSRSCSTTWFPAPPSPPRRPSRSDDAILPTALSGASLKVDVVSRRLKQIRLVDNDRNDRNPLVDPRALDINKGNRQIAHGIVLVLRPADL